MSLLQGIGQALAEAKDIEGAVEIANKFDEPSDREVTMADVAIAHARVGDTTGAFGVLDGLTDGYARTKASHGIALARAAAGDAARAIEIAVQRLDDALMRDHALGEIAAVQTRQGDVGGALHTAMQIDGQFMRERAYHEIAQALVGGGDLSGALRIVDLIGLPFWGSYAFRAIAVAQSDAGDEAGARDSLAKALLSADELGAGAPLFQSDLGPGV